jgi:hypothetical protein
LLFFGVLLRNPLPVVVIIFVDTLFCCSLYSSSSFSIHEPEDRFCYSLVYHLWS